MNGTADGGLAQAVGVSDVGVGAVLTPVHQGHLHQGHQKPVFRAMLGRASAAWQMLGKGHGHGSKCVRRNAGQPFEHERLQQRGIDVKHIRRIPHLRKRSNLLRTRAGGY